MEKQGTEDTTPKLLRILQGGRASLPPIWIMRQAGRYLPEYRAVRARVGSVLDLCYAPDLAAEVTLQPIRRFGFDAAILFSDILVVPHALGVQVEFVEGEGPRLEITRSEERIAALRLDEIERGLSPISETIGRVRADLPKNVALLGFCGAPWTVATYMVAGRGTPDQAPARSFAYAEPALFTRLIAVLVEASIRYLIAQFRAGVHAVQIFDTWAGILDEAGFRRWCLEPLRQIVEGVRREIEGAPIIAFPKGTGARMLPLVEKVPVNAVGLDWTLDLAFARDVLQPRVAVQGNLDPMRLLAGGRALDEGVDAILAALSPGPFIFNLGHGILPETPVGHVERLVRQVRSG